MKKHQVDASRTVAERIDEARRGSTLRRRVWAQFMAGTSMVDLAASEGVDVSIIEDIIRAKMRRLRT